MDGSKVDVSRLAKLGSSLEIMYSKPGLLLLVVYPIMSRIYVPKHHHPTQSLRQGKKCHPDQNRQVLPGKTTVLHINRGLTTPDWMVRRHHHPDKNSLPSPNLYLHRHQVHHPGHRRPLSSLLTNLTSLPPPQPHCPQRLTLTES